MIMIFLLQQSYLSSLYHCSSSLYHVTIEVHVSVRHAYSDVTLVAISRLQPVRLFAPHKNFPCYLSCETEHYVELNKNRVMFM